MRAEQPGIERALAKLRARDVLSEQEEKVFVDAIGEIKEIPADKTFIRAGTTLSHSTLLLDGIACRYKDLSEGQRQIQELHIAGDFLDLHGFLLKSLDHHVGSLTAVRIAIVSHEKLREITENQPHLARMLWFSTLLDASIQREWIVSVGRRSARSRIAHLLCEMYRRLKVVGLAGDNEYHLPLTQSDLADASGLTSVHVNRMLKQLRSEDMLTFRGHEVVIHDWERLQRAAEFDPAYLHLERRPR